MDLERKIDAFEEKYRARVRRWAGFVDPAELDDLIEALTAMEGESQALTQALAHSGDPLYESRWLPLLKDIMSMIPSISERLHKIRSESRSSLDLMDKGKQSLTGYRKGVASRRVIFDEDA